jgi:small-conductance mechanosensitive channel
LDFVGIDLTTLTVFSGAVGIGLGFGLQKIASNFISGLILLMEKSIEEGDLIELADGTFGFVRRASARYTLVETFDSKEILVPNEDLITSRVVNWTFSNSSARVELEIGVSYHSDIELARDLILQAAAEHPRCAVTPEPACFLRTFGDSSVNFTLHFWVDDVTEGRWHPHSEVMFEVWRKFKDSGIEIPFPQRDLHIRSDARKAAEP